MKRTISLLLTETLLFLFLLSGCGSQPGSQKELEVKDEYLELAMDICSYDGKFYLAAGEQIIIYNSQGKEQDVIELPGSMITNVAHGDTLYALDGQKMQILKINGKGEVEDRMKLSVPLQTPVDLEALGSLLYLSCSVMQETYEEHIYEISWEEKTLESIGDEAMYLDAVNDSAFCAQIHGRVYEYRISDGKADGGTELSGIGAGESVGAFCVDEDHNTYYVSGGNLYRAVGDTYELLHRLSEDYDVIAETRDYILLLKRSEKLTLATKSPEEREENGTLHLYGTGTVFEDMEGNRIDLAVELEAEYGIRVERTSDEGMNLESFLTDLMSGSDKYDIYRFWANNTAAANFIDYHAYEDLSDSQGIKEALDQWYPVIAESCYSEDELFGVPGGVGLTLLYYNDRDYPELAETDFQTWDQFLDVLEKYQKPVAFNRIRLQTVLLEQYVCSYCDPQEGVYDFDTPAFRKVLELMRRIDEMSLKYSEEYYDDDLFLNGEIAGFGSAETYVAYRYSLVPLPSINGEPPVAPFTVGYHVVNPNSSQKENAMLYMEKLAEQSRYFNKNTAGQYPKLAEVMERDAKRLFGNQAEYGDAIDQYVNEKITAEEAIAWIEDQTDIRVNE